MSTILDKFAQPLSQLAARYAQSPIPNFLSWWGQELHACLPARWRHKLQVSDRWVLLQCDDGVLRVELLSGSTKKSLGELTLDSPESLSERLTGLLDEDTRQVRRILLVPNAGVLRRNLQLPAAAIDNLSSVVGFELDRQTPFRADQVRYDARVLPHEPGAKQVPVQLGLITRERFAQELERVGSLAGTLSAVDVLGSDGKRAGFNFLPSEQRSQRSYQFAWVMTGLAAIIAFFLWLGMTQVLNNRAEAIERLEAEVEEQREQARAVTRLRDELDTAVSGANFLAIEKASQPSMLLLLDELTRVLPNDTYLERLSVSQGTLNFSGQSAQAPKLLELLQTSDLYSEPSLSGAIQPDQRTGKDKFNITARFGKGTEGSTDAR